MILLTALLACGPPPGPTEDERTEAEADQAMAWIFVRSWRDSLTALVQAAPTDDSARRVLHSPVADSVYHWQQKLDAAERVLQRMDDID